MYGVGLNSRHQLCSSSLSSAVEISHLVPSYKEEDAAREFTRISAGLAFWAGVTGTLSA